MNTRRKPLEGQLPLPFMAEKKHTAKPRLTIVRAEAEDAPAEAKPKPVKRRRLPKAG
jgi:hypothetical protein